MNRSSRACDGQPSDVVEKLQWWLNGAVTTRDWFVDLCIEWMGC